MSLNLLTDPICRSALTFVTVSGLTNDIKSCLDDVSVVDRVSFHKEGTYSSVIEVGCLKDCLFTVVDEDGIVVEAKWRG